MQAVLQAFFEEESSEASLINVLNRGGDADTTGAILGMISGALYGLEAIPSCWPRVLNSDIKDACRYQAGQLIGFWK